MSNIIEFVQGSKTKQMGTKEVLVLNQSDPVYVKEKAVLTGYDIISLEECKGDFFENFIRLKLSLKGMEQLNEAYKDKNFPMLVFFVNGVSMQVIHSFCDLDEPKMVIALDEDDDFFIAFAELIKSGMKKKS